MTSCIKMIDIEIPEYDRKLVVNALINPDSLVVVGLTRSNTVITQTFADPVGNATILLYENDQLVGSLIPLRNSFYYLPDFKPSSGRSYRLEISAGELKPVIAVTRVPDTIGIIAFDTTWVAGDDGNRILNGSIRVSDPAQQKNFYSARVAITHKRWDYSTQTFTDEMATYTLWIDPPGLENRTLDFFFLETGSGFNSYGSVFFSDDLFLEEEFEISFSENEERFHGADTVVIDVSVDHIEASYYQYARSFRNYQNNSGNPFSEPVQVYTNVENGLGIFSGFARSNRKIVIVR